MNAEQVSLTHYLCPYKFLNTKDFLVRSYLYLGRSNEWPLERKLMDSSDGVWFCERLESCSANSSTLWVW